MEEDGGGGKMEVEEGGWGGGGWGWGGWGWMGEEEDGGEGGWGVVQLPVYVPL